MSTEPREQRRLAACGGASVKRGWRPSGRSLARSLPWVGVVRKKMRTPEAEVATSCAWCDSPAETGAIETSVESSSACSAWLGLGSGLGLGLGLGLGSGSGSGLGVGEQLRLLLPCGWRGGRLLGLGRSGDVVLEQAP